MDRNAMALYVQVVQCGSFSKAAVREGVPVSTVSRKIAELEKQLGARLLERSTRQLRMTEIGRDYFEGCRRGLEEFEAANALVAARRTELSGRLRISVPPSLSDVMVVPLVGAFQALHPHATVHCLVTERFIDHIADGIDLSLRVGHLDDSSLIARPVGLHRSHLVAAPGYLAALTQVPSDPAQVAEHVQVAFSRWEKPLHWKLTAHGQTKSLTPEPRLVLNDYAGVLRALLDGAGVSELPGFLCEPGLRDGRLVEVARPWRFEARQVSVTYPTHRHLPALVRGFRDFCVDYFASGSLAIDD